MNLQEGVKKEIAPLLCEEGIQTNTNHIKLISSTKKMALLACIIIPTVLFSFNSLDLNPRATGRASGAVEEMRSSSIISLNVSNSDYGSDWEDLYSNNMGMYPWKFLVEPFRLTTFRAACENGGLACAVGATWAMTYDEIDGPQTDILSVIDGGQSALHTCTKPGRMWTVKVSIPDGPDSQSFKGVCKYVRRELNRLHDADRVRFLTALGKYHRIATTSIGKELGYGDRFVGIDDVLRGHIARRDFDGGATPIHTWLSFITGHSLFMLRLDVSLHEIDPTLPVSVPYWDYLSVASDISDMYDAVIFSPKWFGNLSHLMPNSGLLHGALAVKATAEDVEVNPYGYLQQTVYSNHLPYVTRANTICGYDLTTDAALGNSAWPQCDNYNDAATNTTSFYELNTLLNSLHGSVHLAGGGTYDCASGGFETVHAAVGDVYWEKYRSFTKSLAINSYYFWDPLGDYDCPVPGSCDTSSTTYVSPNTSWPDPSNPCRCSHTSTSYKDLSTYDFSRLLEIFKEIVKTSSYTFTDVDEGLLALGELDDANRTTALRAIVEIYTRPGSVSNFATPFTAVNDPMFWPIHNNFEHSYVYFQLTHPMREPDGFNWSWPMDSTQCASCTGHNYHDAVPVTAGSVGMEGMYGHDVGLNLEFDEHITNAETMLLIDPSRVALPYVYDTISPMC